MNEEEGKPPPFILPRMGGKEMFFCKCNFLRVAAICLLSIAGLTYAFEFNERIALAFGLKDVDLSAFSGSNDQFSGSHIVDLSLNSDVLFRNQEIHFYTQGTESYACFTKELVDRLPLKKSTKRTVSSLSSHSTDVGDCHALTTLDSAVMVNFDAENSMLDIKMPQKFLESFDPDWVTPAERDSGISGLIWDYSLIMTHERQKTYDNENSFRSDGVVGLNVGVFRFRSDYQYDSRDSSASKFAWTRYYGFVDVPSLNAKFYAGELYSRTSVLDSVRFKGVSFYSDETMMPSYLQGYAPEIIGTAQSDAIVTLRVGGNVIRRVQVIAGPFAISDLPLYVSGTVDVEVEESNGDVQNYQVEVVHVPFLTRPGAIRYSLNAGRIDPLRSKDGKTGIITGDISYGLNNYVSIYGGSTYTTNSEYLAINGGVGLNLGFLGGLSVDMTQSRNKADHNNILQGQSYRFNYAKKLAANTRLNLIGYRFSSRDYTTINNYLYMAGMDASERLGRDQEKNRFTVSISQYFKSADMSATISMTRGSYWNRSNLSNYNVNLSKTIKKGTFKGLGMSFSFRRSSSYYGDREDQYSIYLNIPLEYGSSQNLSYSTTYHEKQRSIYQNVNYSQPLWGGYLSMGAGANSKRDLSGSIDYSLNTFYSKDFAAGYVNASVNISDNNKRVAVSTEGSVTLTQHGVVAHRRVYDEGSRLIVDAGAQGVAVEGVASRSNLFGLVGISNIPSYYRSNYRIDYKNLPEDVEIEQNVIDYAVTDGAIAYRSLGGVTGDKALVRVILPSGENPPLGAIVYRENGEHEEVGIIGDNGIVYLTGINQQAKFKVRWNGGQHCDLNLSHLQGLDTEIESIACNVKI